MIIETIKNKYENLRKYFSLVLSLLIVVTSCSYIVIVNNTVINTIAREQAIKETDAMNSEISKLENSYIVRRGGINIDFARSMGFEDNFSRVHFSNESGNVAGKLTLLPNEI